MRIIGALIIGFSVSAYGFFLTSNLIRINKQIEKIIEIIGAIRVKMQYKSTVLPDIIKELSRVEDFKFLFLPFEGKIERYFYKICFENKTLLIEESEKKELYNFFNQLGKTDLENQLILFENYSEIFKKISVSVAQKNKSKIKIYPSLSVLLGLLIVLLML